MSHTLTPQTLPCMAPNRSALTRLKLHSLSAGTQLTAVATDATTTCRKPQEHVHEVTQPFCEGRLHSVATVSKTSRPHKQCTAVVLKRGWHKQPCQLCTTIRAQDMRSFVQMPLRVGAWHSQSCHVFKLEKSSHTPGPRTPCGCL